MELPNTNKKSNLRTPNLGTHNSGILNHETLNSRTSNTNTTKLGTPNSGTLSFLDTAFWPRKYQFKRHVIFTCSRFCAWQIGLHIPFNQYFVYFCMCFTKVPFHTTHRIISHHSTYTAPQKTLKKDLVVFKKSQPHQNNPSHGSSSYMT